MVGWLVGWLVGWFVGYIVVIIIIRVDAIIIPCNFSSSSSSRGTISSSRILECYIFNVVCNRARFPVQNLK